MAIDGARVKAVNSPRRHYTAGQLRELVAHIDERIEAYLEQLDQIDREQAGAPGRPGATELSEKLVQLLDRSARAEQLRDLLAATGQSELSLTDRGQRKVEVGYDLQVAVDGKHDLIVVTDVVQDHNDLGQLHPMADGPARTGGGAAVRGSDAGCHAAAQLESCEQAKIETYAPAPQGTAGLSADGATVYPKPDLTYEA